MERRVERLSAAAVPKLAHSLVNDLSHGTPRHSDLAYIAGEDQQNFVVLSE
jgi:hypothetical protein